MGCCLTLGSHQLRNIAAVIFLLVVSTMGITSSHPAQAAAPAFGLIKDINPSGSSNPHDLTAFCCNRPMLFAADDGTNGIELWATDGTTAGTFLLEDINPTGDSSPSGMAGDSTTKYFSADNGTAGVELWAAAGPSSGWTPGNTSASLAKDINPGPGSSFPADLLERSSTLYFTADDGTSGRELWLKTFSTYRIADIQPGPIGSNPSDLTLVGNSGDMFFAADDGTNGAELWTTVGATAGSTVVVSLVKDIHPGGGSGPANFIDIGGTLYFTATDGTNGVELWKSDGTSGGTVMVKDIRPGTGSSSPALLTRKDGFNLYFTADDGTAGRELWKSDGTEGGTVMVKDIAPGAPSSTPTELAYFGGTLQFAANDGTTGNEPWTSDGTTVGTTLIKDVYPGATSSNPVEFLAGGSAASVIFAATDPTAGREWRASDLTLPVLTSTSTSTPVVAVR